ncbi:hypothetical protein VTK26DRAFT_8894 [Humicola hyalothermophila]
MGQLRAPTTQHQSTNHRYARFGHLSKDVTGHYLFVEPLGTGVPCQSQLVLHYESNELGVRKVLHRRPVPAGRRSPSKAAAAELESVEANRLFTVDAETAKMLDQAARNANIKLRVPRGFSDAAIPDPKSGNLTRVFSWSLCNGGALQPFCDRCKQTGARLPLGLVLRLRQHVLETLRFYVHHPARAPDALGPPQWQHPAEL